MQSFALRPKAASCRQSKRPLALWLTDTRQALARAQLAQLCLGLDEVAFLLGFGDGNFLLACLQALGWQDARGVARRGASGLSASRIRP